MTTSKIFFRQSEPQRRNESALGGRQAIGLLRLFLESLQLIATSLTNLGVSAPAAN